MLFFIFLRLCRKIHLAIHIQNLVEPLHADAIQQLEVVLLGTPAAKVLDALSRATFSQQAYTSFSSKSFPPMMLASTSSTIVVPPQVPIVGVTQVLASETLPSTETAVRESKPPTSSGPEVTPSKCHKIMPTPIPAKSSSMPNLPTIVVHKLAVLTHALPEWINHPEGHKDYKWQLCVFQHMNRDCMLMHIQQHLEISVGCPMCSKGFQNVASLCKHGQQVHSVNIVESEHE